MINFPLTPQDLEKIEDEYAFVRDVWIEMNRLAENHSRKCTEVQNNYDMQMDKMLREYSVQKKKLEEERDKKCSDIEKKERQLKKTFGDNIRTLDVAKVAANNQYNKKKNEVESELKRKINKLNIDKNILQRAYDEFSASERELRENVPYYNIIIKQPKKTVSLPQITINDVIYNNSKKMVEEIRELDKKHLSKLLNSSELYKKCLIFYYFMLDSQKLIKQYAQKYAKDEKECREIAENEIREANAWLNSKIKEFEGAEKAAKQKYKKEMGELNSNEAILSIKRKYSEKLNALECHYEEEKERAKYDRRKYLNDVMINDYEMQHLKNLPPKVLQEYFEMLNNKKILGARDFTLATEDPRNIAVGNVCFKFEHHFGNEKIEKYYMEFLEKNYDFIFRKRFLEFPHAISLDESLALYFKYNSNMAEIAKQDMQALCLNAFLAIPPNKMRFHFIDPLKSGQSFAVFKHFENDNSSNYKIIMGGIQTDQGEIEQQLQTIVDHIKSMHTNTFKGQYKNIREYNTKNVLNPQPYIIVGIMDFPNGFTEKSVDLLRQVVATGKECGIYTIIMSCEEYVAGFETKTRETIADIERMCTTYIQAADYGYFTISDEKLDPDIRFVFDKPIDIHEIINIAPIMKKGIKDAGRIKIDYKHIAPKEEDYWKFKTGEGISIPIGFSGASEIQQLNLGMPGSQSVHALICGQIGSGKSRLLHTIITGALLKYPKEELEIYLVDFKSGTEFKIYADYNLPNFKVIAIESEQEFGLSVLRSLEKERERRTRIFNDCSMSDITSYNGSSNVERYGYMPRVLMVIDEFHVLFSNANTDIAKEATNILDTILRLDRSFGFHCVLCSQSIRGMNAISEAALAQVAVRIALKCPKEDADIVLGEGADAMSQIEENDAGSAIFLPAISSPKVNNKFKVGYLDPEKHIQTLQMLDNHYNQLGQVSNARVLVSDVSDSRNSVFQTYNVGGEIATIDRNIHLGEPLKVEANLEIKFDMEPGNNMLLIGKDSQKAQNMLFFATMDLMIQHLEQVKSGKIPNNIYVLNYCDGMGADFSDKLAELKRCSGNYINYYNGSKASGGIEELFSRFETKKDVDTEDWLIISHVRLASDLQSSSVYGSNKANASKFRKLLKEGPTRGIFSIVWCDDPEIYKVKFKDTFGDFGKRVVFNVSSNDALELADVINDDSINKSNAYVYQDGKGNEKFRPYSTPTDEWVSHIIDRFNGEDVHGNNI